MESFFSPYRGSSTSKYPQVCADDNGDSASVLRQAIRVLNVPTGKHCAKVQDSSTGEGITEEEDAEPFWSVILQRHKAEGIVGLGKPFTFCRVQLPRRRQTVIKDPKADLYHEEHANYVSELLHDLEDHTQPNTLPLTRVAADDGLLVCHSHQPARLSLQHAAYAFDLCTFLINRLDLIYSDHGCTSQGWTTQNADCKRLKDEKYIANLLYLLRRLQYFLFQVLVHRSLKRLDNLHDDWQKHDSRQEGKALDADWFSEWPSGPRPLSTTWPWNIRPSLVVLWGVCWMFYPSEQGNNNDNTTKVPAQYILASEGFMESWAQNLSQPDLDEAANIHFDEPVHAYSQAPGNDARRAQAANNYSAEASLVGRSSPPAAPHFHMSNSLATPSYPPPNLAGINTGHQSPQQGLVPTNPRLHVDQNAYNLPSPAFAGLVSRDLWVPATSGGEISSYAFDDHDNANVFTPAGYQTPISQAQPFFPRQTPSADVPTLEVSPINGPNFSPTIDIPTPTRPFRGPRRVLISNFQQQPPPPPPQPQPSMGISDAYPISPQSERHRSTSIATSASPHNSLLASPAMSTSQSPHNSESGTRHRVSVQRAQEPPRNAKDEIYCNHEECEANPPTFRRRCEWNKHMDKHERPYKCTESGCEKLQGFTYSGGLLRHQREVHKKNGTAKATLFCPEPNCNRHSGTGFTRKENLNEHIRRRHVLQPAFEGPQSPPVATASKPQPAPLRYEADSSRKRKRTLDSEVETRDEDDEDAEFDDSGLADTEERQELNKKIKLEAAEEHNRVQEYQKLKDAYTALQREYQALHALVQEKNQVIVECRQRIYELEGRSGATSGRFMTAPPPA